MGVLDWISYLKRGLPLVAMLVLTAVATLPARAQKQGEWSPPLLLSSGEGKSSDGKVVADQYGFIHVFWSEDLPTNRSIIQYARFDGITWTTPNDLYLSRPFRLVVDLSATVDQEGTLHLAWSEGSDGPVYYTRAPATEAFSAQSWERPLRFDLPANDLELLVDSQGTIHLLYVKFNPPEAGVYYLKSIDGGVGWTDPMWLDPDIPTGFAPRAINFGLDDQDGLHAVWYYISTENFRDGDWVRYSGSLDRGQTWSTPFTLAINGPGQDLITSFAGTKMAVSGESIHVIWAAGDLLYRHHRYSSDAGRTWQPDTRILGTLNGQANDGMAIDGLGRIHYFSQIRYPQGIYHTIWDSDRWQPPELIYLVSQNPDDPIGNRIHAHNSNPAIRAGNQIILTFTDPPPDPGRRLFVMYDFIEDVTPATPLPAPSPTKTPTRTPTATSTPDSKPSIPTPNPDQLAAPVANASPDGPLWIGFLAPVAIILGVMTYRMLRPR